MKTFYKFGYKLKTGTITYRRSSVFYRKFGTGSKKLFCFHGYGESGETFNFLEPIVGTGFTLIAFDLPFHGQTQWNEGLNLTIDDLIEIINRFVDESEMFCLLGYSMGGRLALHLLETIPQKINQVFLIAPDGLHKNFWYYFSTQTLAGNKLFAYTMRYPAWFLMVIKFSRSIGLVNKNIFGFAFQFLDNATNRMLLYQRWTAFRKIKPNLSYLKKSIRQNNVQVKMLFGKYDKIILAQHGLKFQHGCENKIFVTEINAGHQLLRSKYAGEIARLFNS